MFKMSGFLIGLVLNSVLVLNVLTDEGTHELVLQISVIHFSGNKK